MKPFRTVILATAVAASLAPRLSEAAVNPAIIPADARWVVYADLNTLRGSTLGKELVAWARKEQLEEANSVVGVDADKLMATIGTMTAFGSNFSMKPEALDGTLVLQGTPDLRKIAEGLLLQQSIARPDAVSESKELPFPSYTMKPKNAPNGAGPALIVAFPPEPIVVISRSRAQVQKARDAFRGSVDTIAKAANAPLKSLLPAGRDAYLFATTLVPPDLVIADNQPRARILKMTNSGSIAVGERGQNTFARAQLLATSDEMADKAMKIVQGMMAMLSLAETNDRALADFLSSADVVRNDRLVSVDLNYSSERLAQMIRSLQSQSHRTPEEVAAARAAQLVNGRALAEWQAEPVAAPATNVATRTIDDVPLKTGTVISLGRQSNGGKSVRFDHVEIAPVGGGAPLTFRPEFMRTGSPRGVLSMFQFPGADGTYTLRVTYVNDPEGKARYAVSVRDPQPSAPPR